MPNYGRRLVAAGAIVAAAMVAGAIFGPGASAGPLGDQAARAETLLAEGKAHAALEAFDRATEAFWGTSPLQFRTVTFADHVTGFGKYEPRGSSQFHAGDTVTVYLEPVGYGYLPSEAGFRVAMTTDLEIRTPGGLILAKSDDFGEVTWEGRSRTHEVHTTINVALPDLKPGDYLIRLTLADRASAKSASVTMPFEVVE